MANGKSKNKSNSGKANTSTYQPKQDKPKARAPSPQGNTMYSCNRCGFATREVKQCVAVLPSGKPIKSKEPLCPTCRQVVTATKA